MSSRILCFGELLWDLLPTGAELGGAPANLAYHLHSFGNDVMLVSRVGVDDRGDRAVKRIEDHDFSSQWIQRDSDHATGTVPVTLDEETGEPDFNITPDVAYDYIDYDDAIRQELPSVDCICFGSLAQRSEISRKTLRSILRDAPDSAVRFLDINLRKDCYTWDILLSSLEDADIVKINSDEARYLADHMDIQTDNLFEIGDALLDKFNLRQCVITLGRQGALGICRKESRFYIPGHDVEIKDTCGSGDAFSAGYLHMVLRGRPPQIACQVGNAMGALVARHNGATPMIAPKEIRRFISSGSGRIINADYEEYFRRIDTQDDYDI
ncbi:MAG: carbohydrate kinase family protein [Candidatus Sumerlaeota bacterium]